MTILIVLMLWKLPNDETTQMEYNAKLGGKESSIINDEGLMMCDTYNQL